MRVLLCIGLGLASAAGAAAPVEVHGHGAELCARSAEGTIFCWGYVGLPGEAELHERATPIRMPGFEKVAGFTVLPGSTLMAWQADGTMSMLVLDDQRHVFTMRSSVFALGKAPNAPGMTGGPRAPRIRGATSQCLITTDDEVWCMANENPGVWTVMPGKFTQLGTGTPCASNAEGDLYELNPNESPLRYGLKNPLPGVSAQLVSGLKNVTQLACQGHEHGGVAAACGLDANQVLRCTDTALEKRLPFPEAAAWEAASPLIAGFANTTAPRFMGPGVACALKNEALVCWGERGSALLGSDATRTEPEQVLTGVKAISASGGVTCAQRGPSRLTCFGQGLPTRELQTPEPIDRLIGGHPLCVRGAKTHSYFCRDPFNAFFRGALRDGFERVKAPAIRALAVDDGIGITLITEGGRRLAFSFRSVPMPLKFEDRGPAPGITRLLHPWVEIDAAGRGVVTHDTGSTEVTPEPVRDLAWGRALCFTTPAGTLKCGDRVIRDNVDLLALTGAFTSEGKLFSLFDDRGIPSPVEVKGVPRLGALAGTCGLTMEGDVWCWGAPLDRPGARFVLEGAPARFPN